MSTSVLSSDPRRAEETSVLQIDVSLVAIAQQQIGRLLNNFLWGGETFCFFMKYFASSFQQAIPSAAFFLQSFLRFRERKSTKAIPRYSIYVFVLHGLGFICKYCFLVCSFEVEENEMYILLMVLIYFSSF